MTGYAKSLGVDVSVNGEAWVAKFSASAGYKEIKEGTSKSNNVYIESVAKCSLYRASTSKRISLDPYFIEDVQDLPVGNSSLPDYLDFISSYGTHYVAEVLMGAKAVQQNTFDEAGITSLKVINVRCLLKLPDIIRFSEISEGIGHKKFKSSCFKLS